MAVYSQAQVKYGPRVGINLATLDGLDMGIGAHAGVFVQAEFLDRAGIQPEFVYSIKTGSKEDTDANGTVTNKTTVTASYIEVPLLFYVGISEHLTLLAGPHITNSVSGKQTDTPQGAGAPAATENNLDLSLGGGFSVGLETYLYSPLKFGVRYSYVNSGDEAGTIVDPNDPNITSSFATTGQSSTIMFTATYTLDW